MTQIQKKTIYNSVIKHEDYHVRHDTHPELQTDFPDPVKMVDNEEKNTSLRLQTNIAESFNGRNQGPNVENFITGEYIGTEIIPRCGSCRCGKCPTIGHTYSFKEEQELRMIQGNLEYDLDMFCYPLGIQLHVFSCNALIKQEDIGDGRVLNRRRHPAIDRRLLCDLQPLTLFKLLFCKFA